MTVAPRYSGVKPHLRPSVCAVPRLGGYAAATGLYCLHDQSQCQLDQERTERPSGRSTAGRDGNHHATGPARRQDHALRSGGTADDQAAAELVRSGLADPPEARLDVDRFLATPRPRLANGLSVSEFIVAEREAGAEIRG